jgi:anaerobic selenocysteine-containing dehydrogenase
MFGAGAMTNSIDEIRDADFLFVIGSNTSEAHPIIAMEMKRAVRRGARMVVADPRAIWLTEIADMHLQLTPGTDVWLLNAMAHTIVEEDLCDEEFVATHTTGFDALKKTLLPRIHPSGRSSPPACRLRASVARRGPTPQPARPVSTTPSGSPSTPTARTTSMPWPTSC